MLKYGKWAMIWIALIIPQSKLKEEDINKLAIKEPVDAILLALSKVFVTPSSA